MNTEHTTPGALPSIDEMMKLSDATFAGVTDTHELFDKAIQMVDNIEDLLIKLFSK